MSSQSQQRDIQLYRRSKPPARADLIPNAVIPPRQLYGSFNGSVDKNKMYTYDDGPGHYDKNKRIVARLASSTPIEKKGNFLQNYFQPTVDVRKRDIFREFVNQGGFRPGVEATAKAIPRDMARFAISVAEAPNAIRTGKANGKFYNTPFGRINSFQSEAQNRVQRGDQMWKAMGNPMMDTILGGSDFGGVAGLAAKSMRGVSPLARDFTNKLGTPFESKAMQMRPGMTTKAVDGPSELRGFLDKTYKRWRNTPRGPVLKEFKGKAIGNRRIVPMVEHVPKDEQRDVLQGMRSYGNQKEAPFRPREIAEAIGIPPERNPNPYFDFMKKMEQGRPPEPNRAVNAQAIVTPGMRPDLIPEEIASRGKVGNKLFQGGINQGDYTRGNAAYILDSTDQVSAGNPGLKDVAAAVRDRANIVLEMPTEDVTSKSYVSQGIREFLESHNYTESAPGVWKPGQRNLQEWLFKNVGSKKIAGDIPERTPAPEEEFGRFNFGEKGDMYIQDGDKAMSESDLKDLAKYGEAGFMRRKMSPSYASQPTDDMLRTWTQGTAGVRRRPAMTPEITSTRGNTYLPKYGNKPEPISYSRAYNEIIIENTDNAGQTDGSGFLNVIDEMLDEGRITEDIAEKLRVRFTPR